MYGFHIMVDAEGRKDLFYVLYERYPQEDLDKLVVVSNLPFTFPHIVIIV